MSVRRLIKSGLWFFAPPLRHVRHLLSPGARALSAGAHSSARLTGGGHLVVTDRAVVGRRTRLTVPHNATLELGSAAWLGDDCDVSVNRYVSIGAHTSLQDRTIILGDVILGAGCACGPNLYISSSWHRFEDSPSEPIRWQDRRASLSTPNDEGSHPVEVGDDCWIGINVVISPGVTVGRGCVIGANSVVTRDVPPYTVVAGAPAKPLRKRLEFVPPSSLRADNVEDLPYFYSGFRQWSDEYSSLQEALEHQGWAAYGKFKLAVSAPLGFRFCLDVYAPTAGTLQHGSQLLTIAPGETTFSLSAEPDADGLLAFNWNPAREDERSFLAVRGFRQEK